MNLKEIETMVKDHKAAIEGLQARITDRDSVIEAMKAVIEGMPSRDQYAHVLGRVDGLADGVSAFNGALADVQRALTETNDRISDELGTLKGVVEDHSAKIDGRNKSAPTKRNMTDADALSVLTGEYKEMTHKEAAEKIGLTYAQVYSARLEFTFKHVHKDLREQKWTNPWAK